MLKLLEEFEVLLPGLLKDETNWNSLLIDYETPNVYRLWRQMDDEHRLMLHRIMPCDNAYLHQHPWPSAIHVLDGSYEMRVGTFDKVSGIIMASTIVLAPGSKYEMLDHAGMHSVKPIGMPSHSIMVIGKPWQTIHKPTKQSPNSLDPVVKQELLNKFLSLI